MPIASTTTPMVGSGFVNRVVSDIRFNTQWTTFSWGEPSDHGGSCAFTATLDSTSTGSIPLWVWPASASMALSTRIMIRVTGPSRVFLATGVAPSQSIPASASIPPLPPVAVDNAASTPVVDQPVINGAPAIDTRLMGDLNICGVAGYTAGLVYRQSASALPTEFIPPTAAVTVPSTTILQVDSVATPAASGLITTVLRIEAGAHAALGLQLVPDFVAGLSSTYLVEAYCDGNIRTEPYISDGTYLFWNGASFPPTEPSPYGLPPLPALQVYPAAPVSSGTLPTQNAQNYFPLEYLASLPGVQYTGRIDGYSVSLLCGNLNTSQCLPIAMNDPSHTSYLVPVRQRSTGSMGFSMTVPLRDIGTGSVGALNTSGVPMLTSVLLLGDVALQASTPAGAGTQTVTTTGTIGVDSANLSTQILAPYRYGAALYVPSTNQLVGVDTGVTQLWTRTRDRIWPSRVPVGQNFGEVNNG